MIDFKELDFNEEFSAAFEALENTAESIYITGKAGTGKSTLLQYFRHKTTKNIAILAPTGVAAINIKGQTIHSFFCFKPDITLEGVGEITIHKRRRKMYQALDAVIIDEISMVRADLIDCMDVFLRTYGPKRKKPFGGIQMIFFGDLFQLPPVVVSSQEEIFKTYYPTPYFFSAKIFESFALKIMSLEKIYRQKDERFIALLNAMREDSMQPAHWQALHGRFKPEHALSSKDFYIVLTTTNALAEKINHPRLKDLSGKSNIYQGVVSGEFEGKSLPASETLEIKPGAQVMLLNNDPEKRWVNGSLGKITAIITDTDGEDIIIVTLENGNEVDVTRHTWEMYQYYLNEENNALESKVVGNFTQYPLKLAWAVTIHKSQGQTFERVIIDIGSGTFVHGQMYVALSRATSLEGVVLKQRLHQGHILMDRRVMDFMKQFLCFLCVLVFSSLAYAQEPSWEQKNKDEPYIGLLAETDTVLHPDGSFDEDYHARVKIQKETAKNLGQWPVTYNKSREQITSVEAFVETPDGRKLEAVRIVDVVAYPQSPLYADIHLKVISFPTIAIGTVIDLRVKTKVQRKQMQGQFWDEILYPSIPTRYARFTYRVPNGYPLHWQAYHSDQEPKVNTYNGGVQYSFIFENTGYSVHEDLMPPVDETLGVLSVSSMKDWDLCARFWRDTLLKSTVDDDALRMKTLDIIRNKFSLPDKLRAILEFIQDNFRYLSMRLGDHAPEAQPTNVIFQNRYGNQQDLTLLTRQMLAIAGINARLCLFSGEFNGNPQHRAVNPSMFERNLLAIVLNRQEYYVDPLAKGFDLGQLPSSYDNGYLLIVDADSYHFKNLPVAVESEHLLSAISDIALSVDGSADFQVHVTMPVETSVDFKKNWDAAQDVNKEKFFDNLQASFAQGGTITDHEVKGLDQRYGVVAFNFKYAASRIYQTVNDMILLKEENQGNVPDFSAEKRAYPVFIPTNSLIINRNIYHIPESLRVSFIPSNYHLTTNAVDVEVAYSRGEGTVTLESRYHLKRAVIPLEGYADLKKFYDSFEQKAGQYIILKKKTNIAPEAQSWIHNQ